MTGSKDAIKVALRQAEDRSGISFILQTFDASGTAVSPAYDAPLVSVGAPDGERRQLVVFATDASRRGGTYRFKVSRGAERQKGRGAHLAGAPAGGAPCAGSALSPAGVFILAALVCHTMPASPKPPLPLPSAPAGGGRQLPGRGRGL